MNPLLGPHEGREFDLLDKGKKHVAFFYEIIPEKYFEYKSKPDFSYFEFEKTVVVDSKEIKIPYVILFKKTAGKQAARLLEIERSETGSFDPDLEWEVGRILGYTDEAIDFFIQNFWKSQSSKQPDPRT